MSLPATTRITSPYGESADYDGFHNGIDFAHIDPNDTPVFAFRAGVVTFVGVYPGWAGRGYVVIVDHGGGVVSWSCHLASSAVNVGDRVAAGQRIGTMGNTGTKYVHLHWMIYLHGQVVDPTPYLTASAGGGISPFDPEEDDMIDSMFAVVDGVPSWCWLNWGTGKVLAVHTQEEADWVGGYMGSVRDNWANDAIGGDKYKNKLAMLGILGPARIEITAPGGQVDYDRIRSMIDAGVAGAFDGLELKVSRA